MSIFKTKGIILKIDKIDKNNFLYTIFSYDYGKIKANKKIAKKEKNLDIGYNINFEIVTKEETSIHKIRNIKILSELSYENKGFSIISNYLELISIVLKNTPDGMTIYEIYNILSFINTFENLTEEKLILAKLKILNILGELNIHSKNKTTNKILHFINSNNINNIFRLKGISEEQKTLLQSFLK